MAIFVVTISVFINALSLKKRKGEVLEYFGGLHSFLGSLPSISVIKPLCDLLLLISFHINLNLRPARRGGGKSLPPHQPNFQTLP